MAQKSNNTAKSFMPDKKVKPLDKMTTQELKEMFARQSKLVNNRAFLDKLPDKGNKIKESQAKIQELLKRQEEDDQLSDLLSGLTLKGKTQPDVNKMEWNSGLRQNYDFRENEKEPKDETDEADPIKILATTNQLLKTTQTEKVHRVDAKELEVLEEDKFSRELVDRVEHHHPEHSIHKERFLPYKSLRHDHLTAELEKSLPHTESPARERGQHPRHRTDDVTSAYEPPPKYDHVKPLSLEESMALQLKMQEKLKQIELKRAEEKLAEKFGFQLEVPGHLTTDMKHRGKEDADDILDDLRDQVNREIEEEEVFDEDDVKDFGGVTYTYSEFE